MNVELPLVTRNDKIPGRPSDHRIDDVEFHRLTITNTSMRSKLPAFLHLYSLLCYILGLYNGGIHVGDAFALSGKSIAIAPACGVNQRQSLQFAKRASDEIQEEANGAATSELLTEEQTVQMQLNATVADPSYLGFSPSNFDSTQLPIPLFTSVFVLLFSLYASFYMVFVGLNGFQAADESGLPRLF
jgi:hypothetical protein